MGGDGFVKAKTGAFLARGKAVVQQVHQQQRVGLAEDAHAHCTLIADDFQHRFLACIEWREIKFREIEESVILNEQIAAPIPVLVHPRVESPASARSPRAAAAGAR